MRLLSLQPKLMPAQLQPPEPYPVRRDIDKSAAKQYNPPQIWYTTNNVLESIGATVWTLRSQ